MNATPMLNPVQRLRTRLHLFMVAVRKRLTVGVRAILVDGDKVLLVKHTYVPGWHFPGGGVEPGETAEMSAAREAREETGYTVLGRPVLVGLYLNRVAGGKRDHVAVYLWRAFRQEQAFQANLEIADCRWFALDDLPPDVDAGTARRLQELAAPEEPRAAEW